MKRPAIVATSFPPTWKEEEQYGRYIPTSIGTDLEHFYRKAMRTGEKGSIEYYSERIDAWLNVCGLSHG